MNRPESVSRDAGFTMIELLVVMLVGIILMLLSAPELMKYHIRSQLEGVTRETSYVLQRAKYRAIRDAQEVRICADTVGRVITGPSHPIELEDSLKFEAPPGQGDAVMVPGNCFTFLPDGSVKDTGAFRFADVRGNFLEVRVEPQATARVQVRKWNETDNAWYTRDQGGKAWEWKTGNLL